jgi:hypothetical protein
VAVVTLSLLTGACISDDAWRVSEQPTQSDVEILLNTKALATVRSDYLPDELPKIPVRKRLRPCCAFGSEIYATLGPIPIPFYNIPNIVDLDTLGWHTYDSGLLHAPTQGARELAVNREKNGLMYTCHGGFVDTAHVRDYLDWSIHLAAEIGRLVVINDGGVIELPDEGGKRRIVMRIADPDAIERVGVRRLTMWLAQWMAWHMSVWHETATWFGWGAVPGFPEQASAFSPEDLFSNGLGIRLMPAIAGRGAERSESEFNRSADSWIRASLENLGAVEVEAGRAAARAVDGHWWDSTKRVPQKELVMRRNFEIEGAAQPWLVPASIAPPELVEACGAKPKPIELAVPNQAKDIVFADWVTLEIRPSPALRKQYPFSELGPVLTQEDLPALVAEVRKQNRAEFGERADRPD